MKGNLIAWLSKRGLEGKKKQMNNGKKNKKQESTFFIKFLTIERKKSGSIWARERRRRGRNNLINWKWKEGWNNTKKNRKEKDKGNGRWANNNKKNFSPKSPQKKKEEEWSCRSSSEKNNKCNQQDKTTKNRSRKEKLKEENSYKISRKPIGYIDHITFIIINITQQIS